MDGKPDEDVMTPETVTGITFDVELAAVEIPCPTPEAEGEAVNIEPADKGLIVAAIGDDFAKLKSLLAERSESVNKTLSNPVMTSILVVLPIGDEGLELLSGLVAGERGRLDRSSLT